MVGSGCCSVATLCVLVCGPVGPHMVTWGDARGSSGARVSPIDLIM